MDAKLNSPANVLSEKVKVDECCRSAIICVVYFWIATMRSNSTSCEQVLAHVPTKCYIHFCFNSITMRVGCSMCIQQIQALADLI